MPVATVTSKGQITIPAPVRVALGLDAGDRVEFVELEKGRFAIVPATVPLQQLKGAIRKPEKAVSIEEMNTAIAQRRSGAGLKKK
jgi:AbrB family looped-hinge helix DNA binding protein